MDYKEMIERVKYYGNNYATGGNLGREIDGTDHLLLEAATAIETLLAEREAAVEDLRGRCDICKHRRVCLFDEQHRIGCANSKRGHWQWRGPTPPDRQQTER